MTAADEAIARRLRVQCERFGWMGGMLTDAGRVLGVATLIDGRVLLRWATDTDDEPTDYVPYGWTLATAALPDPHDPATIGCFAAMARKATGDARAYARPEAWSDGSFTYGIHTPTGRGGFEDEDRVLAGGLATEIEAWLAVLEATP